MMIARWSIVVKFGHKEEALRLFNRWIEEIGPQVGFTKQNSRLVTGSVGVVESVIESEVQVRDLAELQQSWDKLSKIEAHRRWGKEVEPLVVSGTNRWEIFRVIE
jgi:hypothetical protein